MRAGLLSAALVIFTALALTHAAFVDYRSGATELQPQRAGQDGGKAISANQMLYLQARKYAGIETVFRDISDGKRSIWRGLTRARWTESGLCCGVFELLVKMKGGRTRTALLKSLAEPRNKLQLSRGVGIDWKAIDRHVGKLLQYGLVVELATVGTCKVYIITQKGRRALALVDEYCSGERALNNCP